MLDLLIKNGKIVTISDVVDGDLLIAGGKVAGITKLGEYNNARRVIDAEGRFVLPGAVDTHSHIGQMPGEGLLRLQTKEENFESESTAALSGGVTTAINYIFTRDPIEHVFPGYRELAENHSLIDMKFHGTLMHDLHIRNIEKYVKELGITSFKIFLPYKGSEALDLGGLSSLDDGQLLEAFTKLQKFGALPIVHAENPELIDYYSGKFDDYARQDMVAWEATRPGVCESESVAKVLFLAKKVGCRVCIAHISCGETAELYRAAKDQDVIFESAAHYLALTADDAGLDSLGKVSPPIRHSDDREKIWEAVATQSKVFIGSDHNSWMRAHKQDLWKGLAGLSGNYAILPVLFTEGFDKRGLSPSLIAKVSSYDAAQELNLYPRKGSLQVGSDADIVIMDTGITKKLDPQETGSIVDYTPYQNYTFTAWPHAVIGGGEVMFFEGKQVNSNRRGRCLNG